MYSPTIDSKQIRKMYLLRMSFMNLGVSKPLTTMVKEALDEYIPKATREILKAGGTLVMPDELQEKE